ncbi:hypothetical protein ACWOAH_05495 [Vagococcus vulneris]|uniref:Uncharacterized protein n=1 Tax=Vagococcus vulneris TaxID=1977869 RepID=A0A429ZZD6_9ENTE|nr:hypothetical protein [Vagococcus vulneris]RST99379.1 hypothetical protein CBF37_05255 [Vagococcus vulneris]
MKLTYQIKDKQTGEQLEKLQDGLIYLSIDDELVDNEGIGKIVTSKEDNVVTLDQITINQDYRNIGLAGYFIADYLLLYLDKYHEGFHFNLVPAIQSILHPAKTAYDIYHQFVDKPEDHGIILSREYAEVDISGLYDIKTYYYNRIRENKACLV